MCSGVWGLFSSQPPSRQAMSVIISKQGFAFGLNFKKWDVPYFSAQVESPFNVSFFRGIYLTILLGYFYKFDLHKGFFAIQERAFFIFFY